MPIYQINLWICEVCGKSYSTTEETAPYADPLVAPPTKLQWGYVGKEEKLACPDCLMKYEPTKKYTF